jgi:hypothetical protein
MINTDDMDDLGLSSPPAAGAAHGLGNCHCWRRWARLARSARWLNRPAR